MRKGILLDDNNELLITPVKDENGLIVSGLVIGETDNQNVDLIVQANKGEFKEFPWLGVGLVKYVKSVNKERELIREVNVQLEQDGYRPKVTFANGKLTVETN